MIFKKSHFPDDNVTFDVRPSGIVGLFLCDAGLLPLGISYSFQVIIVTPNQLSQRLPLGFAT